MILHSYQFREKRINGLMKLCSYINTCTLKSVSGTFETIDFSNTSHYSLGVRLFRNSWDYCIHSTSATRFLLLHSVLSTNKNPELSSDICY